MSEHEGNDQVADVRARVFREADRLYEELGRERFPQVEAVRQAARADMNAVTRVMKEWRHLQTAKPEPVHLDLPPELHREALTLGSALWSAATEMANASLRKAEADWDQERADAESTRIELSQLYEEQQGDLERLREDKQALQQALVQDLIAHLIVADQDAANIPRFELFQALAQPRVGQQGGWRARQLLHRAGGSFLVHRSQELVEPCHVGEPFARPLQLHQRGTGSGESVPKLSAQACTAW